MRLGYFESIVLQIFRQLIAWFENGLTLIS